MTPRGRREFFGRAAAATMVLIALTKSAGAQTRTVGGQAGVLGEWELSATLTEQPKGGGRWVGPLSMKHIGFCSVDGPEEKIGELRLLTPGPSGDVTATILVDGDVCTFIGKLKDDYDGVMTCPDRRGVRITLSMRNAENEDPTDRTRARQ